MMNDEIAYFTVRWKTRASFVYRTISLTSIVKSTHSVMSAASVTKATLSC